MPVLDTRTGLIGRDKDRETPGFTLFTPLGLKNTYLVNMAGEVVHSWDLPNDVGNYAYMLKNGNLLAAIRTEEQNKHLPAKGGHLMEFDWDGNVVWEHVDHLQHHDFRRLDNGNTVYLCWKLLTEEQQKALPGGLPGTEHEDGIYGDVVREVTPEGEVVWEWAAAEQMDMQKFPNHPGAVRLEYAHGNTVGPTNDGNILINQRYTGAMLIIDKATKEIVWSLADWEYGQQHDVQMIENGNILFFANGAWTISYHGPEAGSKVVELDPKTNEEVWTYQGRPRRQLFSNFISGAQRLASGNTLICEGGWGRIFEVTPEGEIVWEYVCPFFVDYDHPAYKDGNYVFRAYRYAADGLEIQGRKT